MVVIVEGCNGVGKTTLAKAIENSMPLVRFKPFRELGGDWGHWGDGSEIEEILRDVGVPFNTAVEDFFVADFVGKFNLPLIIDRSLPSALVYQHADEGWDDSLLLWKQLFRRADVRYIWMDAPFEIARNRSERVVERSLWESRRALFEEIFFEIEFPKLKLDASPDGLADKVRIARRFLT